jgi:hypothetical protein
MNHERLAALIQAHQNALRAHPEARTPYEAIVSLLTRLDQGTLTLRQARRLLGYQARRLDDDPAHQPLYRQVAADLRQMQREEHGR